MVVVVAAASTAVFAGGVVVFSVVVRCNKNKSETSTQLVGSLVLQCQVCSW